MLTKLKPWIGFFCNVVMPEILCGKHVENVQAIHTSACEQINKSIIRKSETNNNSISSNFKNKNQDAWKIVFFNKTKEKLWNIWANFFPGWQI